jgi:flagellin-like protein
MGSRGGIVLNKMLKAKKGISPILATLLLIVIAVAAVIVTYAWVMTFTISTTSQAGAVISEANTRFYNITTTKHISVTLLNSGTADAKMTKVYIGTEAANLVDVTGTVDFTPATNIVKANGGSINATWSYTWTSGQRYYFKFITEAGQQVPFDRVAP